jgi:hypothetical protein
MNLRQEARLRVRPNRIGTTRSFERVAQSVATGTRLGPSDWKAIGSDYLHFSQTFPSILGCLISRLDASQHASTREHLQCIHDEELGKLLDRDPTPHTQMFKAFIDATGAPEDWAAKPISETTSELEQTLRDLYVNGSLEAALGAQTAFEMIGEEIIKGFSFVAFRGADVARPKLRYFDEHLVAEKGHVDFMGKIADDLEGSGDAKSREAFLHGATTAGDVLRRFWSALWRNVLPEEHEGKLLFLSWSGAAASQAALGVRDVLVANFPAIEQSDVFFSDTDILSGSRWDQEIEQAVTRAKTALVVLSPHSVTSPWVNFEAGALFHGQTLSKKGQLHVLVLGSRPERFVDRNHPLGRIQRVEADNFRSFIERIADEAERKRAGSPHKQADVDKAATQLETIVRKASLEADREWERLPENAVRWLEYLLSLSSRQPRGSILTDAPTELREFDDVRRVLQLLVRRFMGSRLPPGRRAYVATRLSEAASNYTGGKYLYRLLYSVAGLDTEGTWQQHALVGRNSLIHQCFEQGRPLPDATDDVGASVPGESAVHCRPVTLDGETLCVVGLSSDRSDPSMRMVEQGAEFDSILQWFFSIVSTRATRLRIASPSDTDREIARSIEHQLRRIDELASFDGNKPRPNLLVRSSE